MTTIGTNLRMSAALALRPRYDLIFAEIFGCRIADPTEQMRVYALPGGGHIGVNFIAKADADALPSPAQYEAFGTWIELVSDDVPAKVAALAEHGVHALDYQDRERAYFRLPGGQVFRVSRPDQV